MKLQHYEIRRELGRGAQGVVFEAFDPKLERVVVIKRLLPSATGEDDRSSMLAEARLAADVDHPNVCAIYDIGHDAGQPFIVMQYVQGRPLAELTGDGELALPLVISIGVQIASGLAAAHEHGIVHRDLRPSNIMVGHSGLVKILDFGLARRKPPLLAGVAASPSTKFGSIGYMAPEQFSPGRSSAQSDVFALGVLLYQMLAGAHPFLVGPTPRGQPPQQIIRHAICHEKQPPISSLRAGVPAEFESLVTQCLEKQPTARFSSAAEVRDALRSIWRTLEPGDVLAGGMVSPRQRRRERRGLFAGLLARFRGSPTPPADSLVIRPFTGPGSTDRRYLGLALAEAVASRLASRPGLHIRPPSVVLGLQGETDDAAELADKLDATHILDGTYDEVDGGLLVTWELQDAQSGSMTAGGSVKVSSTDIVTAQRALADDVHHALPGPGLSASATIPGVSSRPAPLALTLSEELLEARALISAFARRSRALVDLERAEELATRAVDAEPESALAHATLGRIYLLRVRDGFDGGDSVQRAHESVERALSLDPGLVEALLTRLFTLLARGNKESARRSLMELLRTHPHDVDVNLAAAVMLRMDGCLDLVLERLQMALEARPDVAHVVYAHRARVYGYRGQTGDAEEAIDAGLRLAPDYPPLRVALGHHQLTTGRVRDAVVTLEAVIAAEPRLYMAYPTLALARLRAGDPEGARAQLTESALEAATSDGDSAYRVATFRAVDGDDDDALAWLRTAIDLGNENLTWFASNPAWEPLAGDPRLVRILEELAPRYGASALRWHRELRGPGDHRDDDGDRDRDDG